jgi:hypothetical protein
MEPTLLELASEKMSKSKAHIMAAIQLGMDVDNNLKDMIKNIDYQIHTLNCVNEEDKKKIID